MQRRNQQGFTLIEVMVALLLLGVGVGSLMAAFSGSERLMEQSRDAAVATELARSKLNEVLLHQEESDADTATEERYNGKVFGYRIEFSPLIQTEKGTATAQDSITNTELVRIIVSWDQGAKARSYKLESARQKPPTTQTTNSLPSR